MRTDEQVNTTGKNGSRGEVMVWVLAFKLSVKQRVYKKRKKKKKTLALPLTFHLVVTICSHLSARHERNRKLLRL